MILTHDTLKGRSMTAADGKVIGQIAGISFESESWRINHLDVKLAKDTAEELGVDHSFFHAGSLEIPVHMVQSVGDSVVLTVPLAGLRSLLPLQRKEPDTSPPTRTKVAPSTVHP